MKHIDKSVSIIIPTYNGGVAIHTLLTKLTNLSDNYNKEIIVIDSQSTDDTINIVESFKKRLNINLIQISRKEFNHGLTRNLGVKLSNGTFVWFLSQDAIPVNNNIMDFYFEDFSLDNNVVAVYGGHIPYIHTPVIQKIEIECYWDSLNKYVDKKGILIQDPLKPFIPLSKMNEPLWFRLSNTSSIYKKSFLLKFPFPETMFGEDYEIGKIIIDMQLIKIYDQRCVVRHSHLFSFLKYYSYERQFLFLRLNQLKFKRKTNLLCKIRKLISMNSNLLKKLYYFFQLLFYYLVKVFILVEIQLRIVRNRLLIRNTKKMLSLIFSILI